MIRDRDSYDIIRSPNVNNIFIPIQPPPAQQQPQGNQPAQQPVQQPVQQ